MGSTLLLPGDTVLACAFLSYSGPFNQEFRHKLMARWKAILKEKSIPFNSNLGVITMLVDAEEIAEWSLQVLVGHENDMVSHLIEKNHKIEI